MTDYSDIDFGDERRTVAEESEASRLRSAFDSERRAHKIVGETLAVCAAERDALRARVAAMEAERAAPPVSAGQRKIETLLRAARVYETHDMALAAPEVQQAIREMAPLVERDPVREMAMRLAATAVDHWESMSEGRAERAGEKAADTAKLILGGIDGRLPAARKPPIK